MKIKNLYPVHPKLKTIHGLTCYKNLNDLPEVANICVFTVSSERTVSMFEQFCKLGGKGAIIFSDGLKLLQVGKETEDLKILVNILSILTSQPKTDGNRIAVVSIGGGAGIFLADQVTEKELTKPLIISPRGVSEYVDRCRTFMADRKLHTYTVPMIKPLCIAMDIWKKYKINFLD